METIQTLAVAFGAAWASGLNLYALVATLGLLGRFGGLSLPGELGVLTSPWVIGVAVGLYCVEFVADKVPWVDSVWDVVHTFVRVPAGAVIAATALGDFDRSVQVVAFLLGGGLALGSHGAKAAARAFLNLSPEPFTNIGASLVEDVLAVGAVLLAFFAPLVLFCVLVVFLVAAVLLLPKIVRLAGRTFRGARAPAAAGRG